MSLLRRWRTAARPAILRPGFRCTVLVPPMSEVTRILSAIEQGDPSAAEQLLPLVYDELRRLAGERMAQEGPRPTPQATALVPEAYLQGERIKPSLLSRLRLRVVSQQRCQPLFFQGI